MKHNDVIFNGPRGSDGYQRDYLETVQPCTEVSLVLKTNNAIHPEKHKFDRTNQCHPLLGIKDKHRQPE